MSLAAEHHESSAEWDLANLQSKPKRDTLASASFASFARETSAKRHASLQRLCIDHESIYAKGKYKNWVSYQRRPLAESAIRLAAHEPAVNLYHGSTLRGAKLALNVMSVAALAASFLCATQLISLIEAITLDDVETISISFILTAAFGGLACSLGWATFKVRLKLARHMSGR